MDVSSDQSVAKAKEYLERRTAEYGGLHGLVNNAGILGKEFFDEFLTLDDYKEVAEVNTWGVIRVTHAMSSLIKQTRLEILRRKLVYKAIEIILGIYAQSSDSHLNIMNYFG
ncbi:hypothetical protein COOONC_12518 [Cooperia oncophora]